MTSKLLKIIGFFCKRALQKRLYSAKEAHIFKEPTSHSHPIRVIVWYEVATISRLLKLYVSFAEYRLFYRALLQKRLIILRSLLTKATPYLLYLPSRHTPHSIHVCACAHM